MSKKIKYNIVQRNKYFDDLGIKPHKYGVNFTTTDEKKKRLKKWKKERKLYGFDSRETWNLDTVFAEWLYTRCTMYLEEADKIVNLEYHKVTYKDKEYTQKEAIEKIRKWALYYVKNKYSVDSEKEKKAYEKLIKASELWALIVPYMWW
mgnify:CR=1 FL=1